MANSILITGATGLLGRYLVRDLSLADIPLALVVRSSRRISAMDRVQGMLASWEQELGRELPRPQVLEGDLTLPNLGLQSEALQWVAEHCDSVLHNAASLTFHGTERDGEPWRSNVQGTSNVLDVCRRTGIRDMHHVSTAYVCGLRHGTVLEDELNVGQEFGNDYERSKVQAEEMVRAASFLSPPTFYRPSIIVGDSETGFTSTFHGFYATLRLAHTLVNLPGTDLNADSYHDTRITLDGSELKNFVPVNWVSSVIAHVLQNREHHGRTFHLTADTPVTVRLITDVLEQTCGFTGTIFSGPGKIDDPRGLEGMFYENMQIYDSYWRNDPCFDKRNTHSAAAGLPCPTVDSDLLVRLARVAIDMGFRWKDRIPATAAATNQ